MRMRVGFRVRVRGGGRQAQALSRRLDGMACVAPVSACRLHGVLVSVRVVVAAGPTVGVIVVAVRAVLMMMMVVVIVMMVMVVSCRLFAAHGEPQDHSARHDQDEQGGPAPEHEFVELR